MVPLTRELAQGISRRLSDKYTLEKPQRTRHKVSKKALDELEQAFKKEVQKEIDSEIIETVCMSEGWVRVDQGDTLWPDPEFTSWLAENCAARYHIFYKRCLFESAEDAMLLRLTWS